jgi:hypothetical protein
VPSRRGRNLASSSVHTGWASQGVPHPTGAVAQPQGAWTGPTWSATPSTTSSGLPSVAYGSAAGTAWPQQRSHPAGGAGRSCSPSAPRRRSVSRAGLACSKVRLVIVCTVTVRHRRARRSRVLRVTGMTCTAKPPIEVPVSWWMPEATSTRLGRLSGRLIVPVAMLAARCPSTVRDRPRCGRRWPMSARAGTRRWRGRPTGSPPPAP